MQYNHQMLMMTIFKSYSKYIDMAQTIAEVPNSCDIMPYRAHDRNDIPHKT